MTSATLSVLALLATAAPIPPSPARWVDDQAAFLSPATRSALDARLEGYQRATGHQVVVWIGKTLDGTPLDDWAVRTFAAWKVGRKGFDDGIAMFILADDHAIDIEVGYGLEDKVPDAIASRVIRDVMTPRLRVDDRDGAVAAGVDAVLAAIEGKPWSGSSATAPPEDGPSTITWILGGLGVIAFLIFAVTHPRMALLLLWTFARSAGGGGGGGFSGGGGRSGGGGGRGHW
jgi:uncharacterized protein